ncbi:MAG: hypothetical protein ABGX05_00710 [Pirellulaceae bacterium]
MKNITSSPRTWFTHSINGLLVLSLMLLGSGCRTDQSQHASIGFRNWVPRTYRSLARQHNRAQEQETQAAGNETVTDQPLTTTVNAIAPNPPQLADSDMPLAPMPQEDIADLVAIENDLPALETTPEQSADAQEEPLAEVASEPTTAPLAPEPTVPLANTDTAQQEPATEPATDTDASDEAALEADVDETPLPLETEPLETEPLETEIATPAPADSTATPLPMPQLPSEADMKVAQEILTQFKQLKEAGDLHHFSIYLRVLGGTAELSGELISEAQHDLLVRTTRTVAGVEEVKDLLVIKDANQEEAPEAAVEQALPPIPVAEAETAEPALPLEAALEPALEAATETTPAAAEAVDPVEPAEETAAAEEAPVQEQEVTETPEPAAAVDEKPASDEPAEPVVIPDPVEEELLQIK